MSLQVERIAPPTLDRLLVRTLRHPLEVAAAMRAREAWGRGIPLDTVVRSAPGRMGMMAADMGAIHAGLYQGNRMIGYVRSRQLHGWPGECRVELVVLHPRYQDLMDMRALMACIRQHLWPTRPADP